MSPSQLISWIFEQNMRPNLTALVQYWLVNPVHWQFQLFITFHILHQSVRITHKERSDTTDQMITWFEIFHSTGTGRNQVFYTVYICSFASFTQQSHDWNHMLIAKIWSHFFHLIFSNRLLTNGKLRHRDIVSRDVHRFRLKQQPILAELPLWRVVFLNCVSFFINKCISTINWCISIHQNAQN